MRRRSFLLALAELVGLAALPAPAHAAAKTQPQTMVLQTSPVAGFQYHDGETIWPMLRIGDELHLVREPRNSFDTKAVKIEWEGYKLGYVPRVENHAVCQLMDRGESVSARIAWLTENNDPWLRVKILITVST
jgi:hypothetical protein